MSILSIARLAIILPTAAALGVFAAGVGPAESTRAVPGSLTCEITVHRSDGMVELQALVSAAHQTSGSYRLRVVKSGGGGSADIDQSGGFMANANGPSVVSTVAVGSGGRYTARLSVTADGRTVECSRRVGGFI
jgi:hypothetical protein